jgi:Rps23 Pro-64 3,4-dihydroxylase Tpa1-like proline 4-hydroxylase
MNKIDDIEELQSSFIENGIVRIENFLEKASAESLSLYLNKNVEYDNAFHLEGSNRQASDKEIAELPNETKRQLYQAIYRDAGKGAGFLYGRNKISAQSPTELSDFLNLLNSEDVIDIISKVISKPDVTHADAQATRYRVGDFLTRHIDNVKGETRQVAYVLGMSPFWHPDWGGLLQFFEKNGTPTKAWLPVFNSLTLFDVNKVHSVTSIAPFAEQCRFSVTGWYRN